MRMSIGYLEPPLFFLCVCVRVCVCHDCACKLKPAFFSFIINLVVRSPTNSTKVATALGMCFVLQNRSFSYRSNNTHLKYTKWKEKVLKNTQKQL